MTTFTKSLFIFLLVAITVLNVLLFIPYPPARAEASTYFTEAEIDNGLQYTFERRFFVCAYRYLELLLLGAFALTGLGRRLADRLLAWSGNRRIAAALGVGLVYLIAQEIVTLPLGIGRLYHARAWGMANLDLVDWLRDHYLAFGITLVAQAVILTGLYLLLIGFPRIWWLLAALGASLLGILYATLAPLLIDPLFNDFTPIAQTKWSSQQSRVQALVEKVGVPVQEILVMNASRQSNHTNAYFTGFGTSRRIVLYDTLLKNHTDAQVESILAHELGHWHHDHIVKGIFLGTCAALLGLFLLDRLLGLAIGRAPWNLQSKADPAGLPFILLLIYLGGWVSLPMQTAVSRHFERQADQFSLDLARQPQAFIASEIQMARDNLLNVAPAPWNVWLYNTHPTAVERIHMAERWAQPR